MMRMVVQCPSTQVLDQKRGFDVKIKYTSSNVYARIESGSLSLCWDIWHFHLSIPFEEGGRGEIVQASEETHFKPTRKLGIRILVVPTN